MSDAAISSLLISTHGEFLGWGCGGAMVGLTGRMIGGGFGTGLCSTTCRDWCDSERLRARGLEVSRMRSTTKPRVLFEAGGGMMPSDISMKNRPTLIATASAKSGQAPLQRLPLVGRGKAID